MQSVRYKCKKCKHVEEVTIKDQLKEVGGQFVVSLFAFGIVAMFGWFIFTTSTNGMFYTPNEFFRFYDDDIREAALNLTVECDGGEPECYVYALSNNTLDVRYLPTSQWTYIYKPLDTLETGGDCKNLGIMYMSMVRSLGFEAWVDCSEQHHHCVVIVPDVSAHMEEIQGYDYVYLVDLTTKEPTFRVRHIQADVDYWADPSLGYGAMLGNPFFRDTYIQSRDFPKEATLEEMMGGGRE